MKKVLLAALAMVLLAAGAAPAFAAGASLDASLGIGSNPGGDFGVAPGFGLGVDMGIKDLVHVRSSDEFVYNLRLRADITYYRWEGGVLAAGGVYRRIPLFMGARYFVPERKVRVSGVRIYVEGGMVLSLDKVDNTEDLRLGLAAGGGIRVPLEGKFFLGGGLRYHLMAHDYLSAAITLGINL